jgi:alpha-galactosidase
VEVADEVLLIRFDAGMNSSVAARVKGSPRWLTLNSASETVWLGDRHVRRFTLATQARSPLSDAQHGRGRLVTLIGLSAEGLEKQLEVALFERYPGFAFYRVSYRNVGGVPLKLTRFKHLAHALKGGGTSPGFWTYSGSTHEDRRDWVLPVHTGFADENYLGMNAADYGGGIPIVDVWRADHGLGIGHLDGVPRLVALPVREVQGRAHLAMTGELKLALQPGERYVAPESFLTVHQGDHFATLDTYRRVMADRGLKPPAPPASAYEPIWCAWGYERQCSSALIEATLPKVQELSLGWVVIDDGWQSNVGDWRLNRDKYPNGAVDLSHLVGDIKQRGLKTRLWFAPLAAAPGSDLLHDRSDMLLLDKDGAPQLVSWWNSLYLCPAYAKTVDYHVALVRQFFGEWGFEGLKIDGQHLNGVAPCFNPAHGHRRPEESCEQLPQFFRAIYEAARQLNPQALIELCPCGTTYSVYDFPYVNQVPASDPESSWQVRLKGKTLKALLGPSAAFAGDHVELSDGGDDFASSVGVGAVISTKFTWPVDPKPKDSFLLTPQREATWRKWIALYREKMLPLGHYRGELYDIGFHEPETHAIERQGRMYYAMFADRWSGPVQLRGLPGTAYHVRDYFNERELGKVSGAHDSLKVEFEHFLLLEARPA